MKYDPPKPLILHIIVLLALLVPSLAWSQHIPAAQAEGHQVQSPEANQTQDPNSNQVENGKTQVPYPVGEAKPGSGNSSSSPVSGEAKTEKRSDDKAWDLKSILTIILLTLALLSSLACLYLLYIRSEPQHLDHGQINDLVRTSLESNLIRRKDLEILIKQLVTPPKDSLADNGAEATKVLESSLAELQIGLDDLKLMLAKVPKDKPDTGASFQSQDITAVLIGLKTLEKSQADILEFLSRPQPAPQMALLEATPVEPPREPSASENIQAIRARLMEEFENWYGKDSYQKHYHATEEFEGDRLLAFAPKRSSLWSDYTYIEEGIRADDFFEVKYEQAAMKPGTITNVERPAIMIKRSYGQTETLQKGMVTVLINYPTR